MHSANSSQRLPSLAPDRLCKMPGVQHTQGIYFTHKEVLLVGCEGRRPAVRQRRPVPRAEFYRQAVGKKKRRDRRKGLYALPWGYIYMQYVYLCVCVRACTLHAPVLHVHVKLNFPRGLNTWISSGSRKESENRRAGVTPKRPAEEGKRFAAQAGN